MSRILFDFQEIQQTPCGPKNQTRIIIFYPQGRSVPGIDGPQNFNLKGTEKAGLLQNPSH